MKLPLALVTAAVAMLLAGEAHARLAAAHAAPRCATSGLVVWLDTNGNGTAGSSYYRLELTNLSGHACTLSGHPGVSAIDLRGRRVGRPAGWSASRTRVVTLASGRTATAVLQVVDAGNFPRAICHQVTAAGLRVYPPGQTRAKTIPFPFAACARAGPVFLRVAAITNA